MPRKAKIDTAMIQLQRSLTNKHHIEDVDALIPEAMKEAKRRYLELPVANRNPMMDSSGDWPFQSCTLSRFYHQEMNRMKREAGLIN